MSLQRIKRLVRFIEKGSKTSWHYGEAILPNGETDCSLAKQAKKIKLSGSSIFDGACEVTNEVLDIGKLLSPLDPSSVGTVRCLGLNYENHAHESKMAIPKYPVLFYKPKTSLCGTGSPIYVHPMFYKSAPPKLDYECELVVVIGKKGINIKQDNALSHVLGYCIGNDVSHREWQLQRGSGQWNVGKAGDNWAPYGPAIVSPEIIKDPQRLNIGTRVNGELVQNNNTSDMIFNVAQTISFLSQGTTLLPGDLIFTGTPEGVGIGRNPPTWLKDGDQVEVFLENVGSIRNAVEFVKEEGEKLNSKL